MKLRIWVHLSYTSTLDSLGPPAQAYLVTQPAPKSKGFCDMAEEDIGPLWEHSAQTWP